MFLVIIVDPDFLSYTYVSSFFQHPFIYPVEYASCTNKGATIVRNFHPTGSLKDHLYKVFVYISVWSSKISLSSQDCKVFTSHSRFYIQVVAQ